MKISVVIPVYNEEKYIEKCLKSVFSQTEKPDEVIVVDNNSTDKTPDILKKFPVKVINETTQGIISARNTGFDMASSELIARIDADTILPPHWIEMVKKTFHDENIDALTGPSYYYDIPFSKLNSFILSFSYFKITSFIIGHSPLLGPNMCLTKKIWEKIKGDTCVDPKKVHEDMDISIHLGEVGTIKFDEKISVLISARRLRENAFSAFVEYPFRWLKTVYLHRKLFFKL